MQPTRCISKSRLMLSYLLQCVCFPLNQTSRWKYEVIFVAQCGHGGHTGAVETRLRAAGWLGHRVIHSHASSVPLTASDYVFGLCVILDLVAARMRVK